MSTTRQNPDYFGAGPALLPASVLHQAAHDLLDYQGEGLGIGEISHRSKTATAVIDDTIANLTSLLKIPTTHQVFFMQGGGTTGFSAVAYNLFANFAHKYPGKQCKAAYAVTGLWLKKAAEEAQRLGFDVDIVVDTKPQKFGEIPAYSAWKPIDPGNTAYLYVCDNETVHGNEFNGVPGPDYLTPGVELVADMSSNILSKQVDVLRYGLIYAGAQKNVGLAGLTIYIIKKSLLNKPSDSELRKMGIPLSPIAFDFTQVVGNNSAYNTIPIFTCQILKLVTAKLLADGGLAACEAMNSEKARILYNALEKYPSFYKLPVHHAASRLRMNVVFTLPTPELEQQFITEAAAAGLSGLKGHRSVGGMRASIYNAIPLESVQRVATFVQEFAEKVK